MVDTTSTKTIVGDVSVETKSSPMSYIHEFFAAMKAGAALVYHDVLAVEDIITSWSHNDPEVSVLINQGVTMGNVFLEAHGIPAQPLEIAGAAVLAGLKEIAANDSTVSSINLKPVVLPVTTPIVNS